MASSITLRYLLLGEDRSASSSMRNLGGRAQETAGHLGGLTSKSVAAGAAIGVMAGQGVTALGRMGLSAIRSGVQTAASMEQANIAFTSLLGSGQKSQAFLAQLSTFAAQTPFELPGLIDASRQLIGVGQSSASVIPTLTAFGDASGALGLSQDNFNHIMMATTQAMSAGTLHAGDLLQMTEAGLPVWKLMSEALHKPVAVLKDMSAKGQLLTKDVMPALQSQMEKDYGGSMAKQSQTLTGLWSTLMDTFHQGMAKAIIPMEPLLRSAIPGAANVLGKALAGLSKFMLGVGAGAKVFLAAFKSGDVDGSWIQKLGAEAGNTFAVLKGGSDAIAPEAQDSFTRMAAGVRGAMSQMFGFIRTNGPKVFKGLSDAVRNLASVAVPLVTQAWNAFRGPLTAVFQFVINTAIPAITAVTRFLAQHKVVVGAVAASLGTLWALYKTITTATAIYTGVTKAAAIATALQASGQEAATLQQKIAIGVTRAQAAATAALNAIMDANPIMLVVVAIAALAAGFVYAYKHSQTFRNIVHAAMGAVRVAIGWVVTAFHAVTKAVGAVIDWVRGHWRLLLAIITGPIGAAVLVITRHWDSIKHGFGAVVDFVRDKVRAIVSFFAGLPGQIVALGGRMLNAGKHLISSWWDGIRAAASGAAHFVGNIISSMANGIKNAINDILHLPWTLPQFKIGAFGHYVHVGGQTLFPRLAQGGMTTGPMLAMMGDNPGGREVALPLNSPHTTAALSKALAQAGGGRSGDVNVNITIQGVVDKQGAAQEIRTVLLGLKRTLRTELGIA